MRNSNIVLIALYDLNSFSVRTLHAVLKKNGFKVNSIFLKRQILNNIMDYPTDNEIRALIKLIKELKPAITGISVRSALFRLACNITDEIKKEVDTLVIWGGIHPTISPLQSIEFADVVCIGEGEEAIVELTVRLLKGEEIDCIQNLWIKERGTIIKNDLRPLINDLDSIEFPDISNEDKFFVEKGNVLSLPVPKQISSYDIMTSRGCPFNCTYCCNSVLRMTYKNKGNYVRRRSVENVIEELVQVKKGFRNLQFITFYDDVFTSDIDWLRKFCNQYKKDINIPFFCYCYPRFGNEEMIRLLKEAGVSNMIMGIQSGSEEVRHKYFERYDTNEDIIRSARLLAKYKINCCYDIIMDNPLETSENKRETFDLLLRLPKPFKLHTYTLTHFPETKLTKLLLAEGIISGKDCEDQKQKSYERWTPALDLGRDIENLFWDNLYYLAKNKYIPKNFLIFLSYNRFLRKHPRLLTHLLRLTSYNIYTVRPGSKIDTIRWYLMSFCKPHLLFEKKAWLFLWRKMKSIMERKEKFR